MNSGGAGGDLVFNKDLTDSSQCCVTQVVLMQREVGIKAQAPPASLALIGQVTMHTTVKWPIEHNILQHCTLG